MTRSSRFQDNFYQMIKALNEELDILYDWLYQNKLELNPAKTKCMVSRSISNCKKIVVLGFEISIESFVIDYVTEIK